ncbi:MAG: tetratricopeptide repeat protein [Acidobacteriota bacterium]|nr:tetratricopeptide repeat protein [Acidobacteriota bacterium]
MSTHLSRKEIKQDIRQDEVRNFLASALVFVREKQRLLMAVGAGLVAVILVTAVVLVLLQAREARAQESRTVALRTYSAAIDPVEPDPDHETVPTFATEGERVTAAQGAFQDLVDTNGGTRAGAVARVYLGEIALEAGDADGARRLWGEFLDQSPGHALAASVVINLIQLDRRDGNLDGAISRLEGYLEQEDASLPRDAVLYQLGRSLGEAGRDEEAQATWERLVNEFPRSPYVQEAQRNLAV